MSSKEQRKVKQDHEYKVYIEVKKGTLNFHLLYGIDHFLSRKHND